jgi:hypothetical protein
MRSSLHRFDDELHIYHISEDSKKIFIRFKEDFHGRSQEIRILDILLNNYNHREPVSSILLEFKKI